MKTIKKYFIYLLIIIVTVIVVSMVYVQTKPPTDFPKKIVIDVKEGSGVSSVGNMLYDKNIIKSPDIFRTIVTILGPQGKILSGEYKFDGPQNLFTVASRLSEGRFGFSKVKITLYEGSTVSDMAVSILKVLPDFNAPAFVYLAKPYEGYLLPDTYTFYENVRPLEVIRVLRTNFDKKAGAVLDKYNLSNEGKSKVIITASLIEKEVIDYQDKRIVAGIMKNRMDKGMPLQFDAPFWYLLNKTSGELTQADLAINSPYNLYRNKGLTPTPISNPGVETIKAALNPLPTKYIFFLTDKDRKVHYAETLAEHKRNIELYLNKTSNKK